MHPNSLEGAILRYRLGSCWKCLVLTVLLLTTSLLMLVQSQPADDAGAKYLMLASAVGIALFGALGLAHILGFVLRRTLYREHR